MAAKKYDRPKTASYGRFGGRAWTEDEENKVKVGLGEGKSLAEIATKCNRTERAIKLRTYVFASQDIAKGTAPDVVLTRYRISAEEFAEHTKNNTCKHPECKNPSSPKSTLGYCAQHLNLERVGKKDLDQIFTKLDSLEKLIHAIAKKLDVPIPS